MVILVLMKLLTLVVVVFGLMLLMLGGIFLVSVGCGILRVLRSIFLTGALHGVEASFLAGTSLRKLRAAFFGVAWSHRQPFCQYWCCS